MKKQMLLLPDEEGAIDAVELGKDEMNFAEIPITLLTDKVPKGQNSIKFEDEIYDEKRRKLISRRRIIEGSEEYGLPTATDDTVVLALIQLTKLKNNFTQQEVEFTRLELIKLLGWADEGASFERLKKSLTRIKLVNYIYDNAWWDTRQKTWTTRVFSILDNVEINDSRTAHAQGGLFPSRIVWNEVVFESFQAGFIRNIDFQLCMRLEHPIALRIYRFLGKRFYHQPEYLFNLKEFACTHLALGGKYEGGTQIARKLKPAIAELEKVGFLEPLDEKQRFPKKGREWSIRFVQKQAPTPSDTSTLADDGQTSPPSLKAQLTSRSVTAKTAAELVKHYAVEAIQAKIEVFDWLMAKKDKRVEKSPAGFLVKSITDDFAAPKGYISQAEQQRRAEAQQQAEQQASDARRRQREQEAKEQSLVDKVARYRRSRTPEQLAQLEAQAIAEASETTRANLADPGLKRFRDTQLLMLTNAYLARLIESGTLAEEPA